MAGFMRITSIVIDIVAINSITRTAASRLPSFEYDVSTTAETPNRFFARTFATKGQQFSRDAIHALSEMWKTAPLGLDRDIFVNFRRKWSDIQGFCEWFEEQDFHYTNDSTKTVANRWEVMIAQYTSLRRRQKSIPGLVLLTSPPGKCYRS